MRFFLLVSFVAVCLSALLVAAEPATVGHTHLDGLMTCADGILRTDLFTV